MKTLFLIFAWWFLIVGGGNNYATVVGPFNDLSDCQKVRSITVGGLGTTISVCWWGMYTR